MSRLAAILLSAAVLSGCGTGLQAQTYKETGRSDGTSTNLESLAIRNLHIEPPAADNTHAAGGTATLTGGLINRGSAADTLTSVTTAAAGSVSLVQDGQSVSAVQIPAGGAASAWSAVLEGLTAPARAGSYVAVTLTFTSGGRTTLSVPIHIGDAGLGFREVHQEPYGEGG